MKTRIPRRRLLLPLLLLSPLGALAQTAPASETSMAEANGPIPQEAVQMSAFEVRTTQGEGYSPGNAATALKGDSALMDLPQNVLVLTNDLVKDIGAANASDTLAYGGVGTYYRGLGIQIRGSRTGSPFVDDVPVTGALGYADNADVDSFEVVKGPMQMLYPGAALGGVVLEATKKPLPGISQVIITAQVNQYGGNREGFDFNGPMGHLGDGTLTYRIVGAYQSPEQIFYNVPETRELLYPDLEWDWHDTKIIAAYDVELQFNPPGAVSILTPTGGLYTGDGRRVEGAPPNDSQRDERHEAKTAWIQKISSTWENKFTVSYENELRYGIGAYPSTVNWNTNLVTYTERLDYEWTDVTEIVDDVHGRYQIGIIPMVSQFGFNHTDENDAPFNYRPSTTTTIPIGSAAAINSIVLPTTLNAFPNYGTVIPVRDENYTDNGYFMETADIVPDWLTVVGGLTFAKIETITDTNANLQNPYPSTDLNGHDLLHRLGAILHLTKEFMLYAEESTTFQTSAGVTYFGTPLPLVQGKNDEVGFKTSFLNNRISTMFDTYHMTLTNQSVIVPPPAVNILGASYYIPVGTTTSRGWDASISGELAPGWQLIAAGYVGTVRDQNGNPVSATYGNQWSVFTRYDFPHDNLLKGLAIGCGVFRQGARYDNSASLILPGGTPTVDTGAIYSTTANSSGVALLKLHEGTMVNLFASYDVNKHLNLEVSCENALNDAYPLGYQGVGLIDPSDPLNFTFKMAYKF